MEGVSYKFGVLVKARGFNKRWSQDVEYSVGKGFFGDYSVK